MGLYFSRRRGKLLEQAAASYADGRPDESHWLFSVEVSVAVRQRRAHVAIALSMLVASLPAGCSGKPGGPPAGDQEARLVMRIVSDEYGEFLAQHGGQPPGDVEAMRSFLESRMPVLSADYNIKSPDDLLTSPRDGQPLVIVCGRKIAPPDSPETPWAAYEQTGVDGNRLASGVRYGPVELTPEEFARQIPAN